MLDVKMHKAKLVEILLKIFTDRYLSNNLVFKGGTALMLFYDLDRFSTDLDLDLSDAENEFDYDVIKKIIAELIDIKKTNKSYYMRTYVGNYGEGSPNIKVEINKQRWPLTFDVKSYYGISVPVMSREKMLAHKLCAITDRKVIQNRDIYDANFMLEKNWQADEEIIKLRCKMTASDYYLKLADLINTKAVRDNILNGLGNVLGGPRRDYARKSLIDDLRVRLLSRVG